MATYFPSSNNRTDSSSSSMFYQREPATSTYSETPVVLPGNNNSMMYMNYPSSSGSFTHTLAGNPIDIPTVGGPNDSNAPQQEFLSTIGESRMEENDFSAWRNGRNEMVLMQNLQGQGLSLSLSPQIPSGIQMQYRNINPGFSTLLSPNSSSFSGDGRNDENFRGNNNQDSVKTDVSGPYGTSNMSRTISSSKYLKAAQYLLDEVVDVRKALKQNDSGKELTKGSSKEVEGESKNGSFSNPQDSASASATELSAAEKQDLQNKMTKLISMLDEVDRRYKQYYHQMQIVVSSFDVIAGCGAAKPYTALALQTISRHFRCLRDAINGQIKVTQRSLGETDASGNGKGVGISRLRYVDQQLKQQRALQQLGMMQQHTWRPQRGLPESSVSVLRAWLFEHFLHPYPKDSDKIMLARQTGLTRSQVSNWFINARVRLWKPMVEEMYKEEAGDVEMESNSSSEIAPKTTTGDKNMSKRRVLEDLQASTPTEQRQFFDSRLSHAHDIEMVGPSTNLNFQNINHGDQRTGIDENTLFADTMAAYHHMSELGRFGNNGSGVSLTLGLQHCEGGGTMPMSSLGTHQSFITMREDDGYNAGASPVVGPETGDFDYVDSGNRQQQRFGSSHLLHDFVA